MGLLNIMEEIGRGPSPYLKRWFSREQDDAVTKNTPPISPPIVQYNQLLRAGSRRCTQRKR